ncbi:MAG: hypothetical protein GX591_19135, partial [Planctomycetes bacterium]|nr:hypothetical protein [Planctomycetota bacterium]
MTDRPSIANAAQAYLSANLCALPAIRAEKRPSIGPWKQYQTRKPTVAEWSAWLANGPEAICILCGSPSGHTEIIDFDAGGELFKAWWASIPATLQEKLVVERTPSGGYHVIYRCSCAVCGNIKLAQRKVGDKVVTLIETRGEGGLFLCAPTPGYELTQGDLANPAVLSEEERDVLLQAAWELNEYLPPVANGPTGSANSPHIGPVSSNSPHMCGCASHNGDRPGDDFNNRGDVRAVLEEHGWVRLTDRQGRDGNEYWRRPGKPRGWSATLKECSEGRIFYVFSSNAAPFEPQTGYAPFAVYTLLEHGGDFEQAARSLRTLGFGSDSATHNAGDPNISPIVRQGPPALARAPDESPLIKRLKTLIDTFAGLNPAVIWNLLRKGETMNIIASPKVGKSWFVSH